MATLVNIKKGSVHGVAKVSRSDDGKTKSTCRTCGGKVLRSWRTGILHNHCFLCRYLVMVYGPSISVSRNGGTKKRRAA